MINYYTKNGDAPIAIWSFGELRTKKLQEVFTAAFQVTKDDRNFHTSSSRKNAARNPCVSFVVRFEINLGKKGKIWQWEINGTCLSFVRKSFADRLSGIFFLCLHGQMGR
jgi:hypothetical protein